LVLRQEFGDGRQVGGELFGHQIGRIDNEHAAAVHAEAVAARGMGMQFGLQPMGNGQFAQFGRQLAAFFARTAGVPPQKGEKPELEALRLNFAAALEDEKITASEANPQIFIKNTYTFMRTHYDRNLLPAQYRSALEPYFDDFFKPNLNTNELILGFSWKAFDFGANKKRREIKRISALQAKLNLDQKRLQNELNLANIKNDLKTLEQKIAAGKSALNSAQTSLNAVSKKYEAGLLGYVEFLNATAQSFSAGSALELSKSKFEIKKAEYLYERGGKIVENIKKTERK